MIFFNPFKLIVDTTRAVYGDFTRCEKTVSYISFFFSHVKPFTPPDSGLYEAFMSC